MKKTIISLFIVFISLTSFSQTKVSASNENAQRSLLQVTYRLFPTQNMWTFIKLNTRNGKIWQVQYDVEGNNRFVTYLNLISLIEKEKEVNDRFTLYPTQNMWTFILLDQFNGKTWQVQWSIEPENRVIVLIE